LASSEPISRRGEQAASVGATSPGARRTNFRIVYAAVAVVLVTATLPAVALPGIHLAFIAPRLDLALSTALTLGALATAVLALVRYQEGEGIYLLYQAGAFFALFAGDALRFAFVLTGLDAPLGMTLREPGQLPIYLWTLQATIAALLLLVGGYASLRGWSHRSQRTGAVLLLPALAVLVGGAILSGLANQLPFVAPPATLSATGPATLVVHEGPAPLLISQAVIAVLFLLASLMKARLYRRQRQIATAYLSVGLLFAAFAELHFAIVPGGYVALVTSWDVMRTLFYGILLAGMAAGARRDLRALREANEDLVRLGSVEAKRAAFEERARVAREIHDGLVQDLWLARVKQGRLSRLPRLPTEIRELATDVDEAIDAALREARHALNLILPGPEEDRPFRVALQQLLTDFAQRYELAVSLSIGEDVQPVRQPVQSQLLGIVREALNNARKHSEASSVHVDVALEAEMLRIAVSDNGKGFDAARVSTGLGLQSMRDRAHTIGAEMSIASRPGEGTVVMVTVPLDLAAEGKPAVRTASDATSAGGE
jgi:signal transduction histidine kinase